MTHALAACALVLALSAVPPAPDDLPDEAPDPLAKPLTAHAWKSKNDLRFVWWLPKDGWKAYATIWKTCKGP